MRAWLKNRLLLKFAVRENVSHMEGLHVGPGSTVWAPQRLMIGRDVYIGKHVTVEVDGEIGDQVLIANGAGIVGKRDHDYREVGVPVRSASWVGENTSLSLATTIGSDCWIGFNSVIYSGVTIGNSAIVAAGSVVTRDVPENSVVAGAPARHIRWRFEDSEFELHWHSLRSKGVRRLDVGSGLRYGVHD